jgi:hypothetical protein
MHVSIASGMLLIILKKTNMGEAFAELDCSMFAVLDICGHGARQG